MPGDTLIITDANNDIHLRDSLFTSLTVQSGTVKNPAKNNNDSMIFFYTVIIFLILIAVPFFLQRVWKKIRQKEIHKDALAKLNFHYTQYDNLLTSYNSYYKSLSETLRQLFLERVAEFIETKLFKYIGMEAEEKIPLLISAAAIQLTFGLDKFLLDFFDTIYVLQHDYQYGLYNTPFMGHVNQNGIYLSWNNFLRGYEDYTDANNVGIHEMAHALAYVNFMADNNDGEDNAFKKRFKQFSAVARPVFNNMQNGEVNMLGSYAATNYNEFWAVAVENFFEKSLQMKVEMPQLYIAITFLLNQDPLLPGKILYV